MPVSLKDLPKNRPSMTSSPSSVAVGIDIGGTDIKAGLVGCDQSILERRVIPTEASGGPNHVISRVVELSNDFKQIAVRRGARLAGVGIGAPGSIRAARGAVVSPPNLPGWTEVALVDPVSKAVGVPVTLDNDANAAVVGEFWCGAGRGTRDMAMLTLGTGIGGGVVLNGALWRGRHENAGELGHKIVIPEGRVCKCGQRGCLEAYASASTTAQRAAELVAGGRKSSLCEIVGRGDTLTSKHVCSAARAGDALAREVWEETCRLLAVACVNLQHTLNLERIILAGGMSAAGDDLLRPVREHFGRQMWADIGDRPEIVLAELGNDAGFVGAAYLALKHAGVAVGAATGGR